MALTGRNAVCCLVLLALLPAIAAAQDTATDPALPPNPRTLEPGWWGYVNDAGTQLQERVDALLQFATEAVALTREQTGQTDEETQQNLDRLRLNLAALPELKKQVGNSAQPLPPPAPQYRLEDYLALERELRDTRRRARELSEVVRRNEESARIAEKRVDNLLAAYLALPAADPSRLRRGLQIMASRSGLAIAREQLRVRKESGAVLANRVEGLELLLEQAGNAIAATPEELDAVEQRLAALREELDAVQNELRERQARALGASGETPLELARTAWRDQRVIETEAKERELTLEIQRRELERNWLTIALAPEGEAKKLPMTQEKLNDVVSSLRLVRAELDQWAQSSDRELVALRSVDPATTGPRLTRVNNDRLATANQSLRNIAQARSLAADTEVVADLLRRRISEEQGVVAGGVSSAWIWVKDAWRQVKDWLGASLFKIGATPVTAFGLMRVGLILFVAIWISRLFRHALDRLGRRGEGTQSAYYTIGRLSHYVIIAAAIVIGLSSIGLSFSNLAIVAGALGVGIGFGLQSIVNNFVSGLILLFERSLKVGDYVELESGLGGIVREINVRSTLINTNQNLDVLVPNSEFVSGRLTNWTHRDASRRMHIPFGVAYGSDKELVRQAVLEAAATVPHTINDSPLKRPAVWLVNFGDSSLDFELLVWVKQASVRRPAQVHAAYMWAIETALAENGIEIPFPQRDLHLRSGFAAAASGDGKPQQEVESGTAD